MAKNYFSTLKVVQHSCATPISNILINLQLLMQNNDFHQTKTNYQHYLSQALLSAKYLKNIMQTASVKTLRKQKFCVKSALKEVLTIAQKPEIECQLIPFLKLNPNLNLVGSKIHFQESIICLLNNAFESYQSDDFNRLVILIADNEEDQLIIKVTDGGSGFKLQEESQPSKVQKLKLSDSETGTGLKFVKKSLSLHFKAELKMSSYPNKGTTVSCYFPLSKK
jgi:light-regulated signal transduction histidine kinase (bacteriophytochrome)